MGTGGESFHHHPSPMTTAMTFTADCPRCGGTGTIDHFRRVNGGECFLCFGAGQIDLRETVTRESRKGSTVIRLQVTKDHFGQATHAHIQAMKVGNPAAFRANDPAYNGGEAMWTYSVDLAVARQIWSAWKGTAAVLEVWQLVSQEARRKGERGQRIVYQG